MKTGNKAKNYYLREKRIFTTHQIEENVENRNHSKKSRKVHSHFDQL